jgi:hypothetical protein
MWNAGLAEIFFLPLSPPSAFANAGAYRFQDLVEAFRAAQMA